MGEVRQIGDRLIGGLSDMSQLLSIRHCIDMFKIGYRLKEEKEHCSTYISNKDLEKLAYQHLESLITVENF